ncbi:hypothetical protein F5051DRAFT_439805 [Lentinula edodes]|nr:hypothetical protein F5051DRAFT_439805 [Lentinula edodes]
MGYVFRARHDITPPSTPPSLREGFSCRHILVLVIRVQLGYSSPSTLSGAPHPNSPPASPPPGPNSAETTVDAAINELASTIEEPPLGQLALFRSVFGIGVSLAWYIVDDPLWPLLASAGLPCSFCIRGKKEANCSVVPHLACCSNCDDKKPCILGRLARFRYFSRKCSQDLAFARRFLEVHGNPGQRTCFALPSKQWRDIAAKIKAGTNSTVALIELNTLDAQDQHELECLELVPSAVTTPRALAKKRKRSLWQEEGGSSRRKHPVGEVSGLEVVPEVPDHKHKHPTGESRNAEVPDYCRVVLVIRPPIVDPPGPGCSSDVLAHQPSSLPGLSNQSVPPVVSERQSAVTIKTPPLSQRSQDALHPYPRAQATAALKAENEALWAEVVDLRKLLETSRTKTSTLTSILRDTTTSLDERNKDLEASHRALQEVAADRLEYNRVLVQFRAIEAELLEVPLEDAITRFHLALLEVDSYREVALRQKQELSELREQVDKELKWSFEAHEELDAANARAIRLRYRLEELEESVHRYWAHAHVAEELICKYPEDEGLYEMDLPSFSSLQDKLTASEAMLRRMATFAHRLHSTDPANLLHYHNMYVGGLIESVITLLLRSLLHPPEQMRSVVELALEYLSQGCLTHGELHLRSISSLLFYYSNAADCVDGLYQDITPFTLSTFFFWSSHTPSDHIPAVPMMDTVMLMWEDMIGAYVREGLGYPASLGCISPPVEVPSSNNPLPAITSLVAADASDPVSRSTPLFLPGSLSPTSPCSPSPIPSSPCVPDVAHKVVDLTMDDTEDLYESQEEFLARTGGVAVVKPEVPKSDLV